MKRNVLFVILAGLFMMAFSVQAQYKAGSAFMPGAVELSASKAASQQNLKDGRLMITQSTSQTLVQGTVACASNTTGFTSENHFIRKFDLANDFQISQAFNVTNVEFGVENAVTGIGTTQPIFIDLYTTTGSLNFSAMTLIASLDTAIPDMSLTPWSVPMNVTVPAGSILVVDIGALNGQIDGHTFFVGSNNLGENSPSYIAADSCGIANATTYAAINFPNVHLVINVYGDLVTATEEMEQISIQTWPNPVNGQFNMDLPAGEWNVTILDLNGKSVYEATLSGKASTDLSNLSSGMYMFTAENGTRVYREKLMVK
jgi:hypothetical protein